jgi:hypothetical protein
MVPLIYLDWMSRSPLVRKLYGTKSQTTHSSPKLQHDNRDIEYEVIYCILERNISINMAHLQQHRTPEEQVALLHKRVDSIRECIEVFEK